jgi:hypothetical protein
MCAIQLNLGGVKCSLLVIGNMIQIISFVGLLLLSTQATLNLFHISFKFISC